MTEKKEIIVDKADELWVDLKYHENMYQISNHGNIYSKITNKILKPFFNTNGYLNVTIKGTTQPIHRLMAHQFLPKIKGKNQVNHKDGIKINNRLENLEWVNNRENVSHYFGNKNTGVQQTKSNKYRVKIYSEGKQIYLGTYSEIEQANKAYQMAKNILDGEETSR